MSEIATEVKPLLVSLPDFFATPPPEPVWLVDQLILERANGWIGAGAKVGKSYLSLDLLLACSLGVPWLDHFAVPRPLTVVLVEEEDSAWRVYNRITRLCRGRGADPPPTFHLLVRRGVQLDDDVTLAPLLSELELLGPDLVSWDVFNRLHTKDERNPGQMLPILRRVDQVRNELGCANLINHHSRKPGATGPDLASGGQKLRGPSEFWGWAENSLYLSTIKGGLRVEPESKDALVEPFAVHLEDLDDDCRLWVYDGPIKSKLDKGARTREAIVELLRGTWLGWSEISAQLNLSERTVKGHLASLEAEGVVDAMREPGKAGKRRWTVMSETGAPTQKPEEPPF
jgi:DNA-binding transcriptional ArsR family regulator